MVERIDEREEVIVDRDGDRLRKVVVKEDNVAQQNETVRKVAQLVYVISAVVETLIGLRVFLRMIAANPSNTFAGFIYNVSDLFVWPFGGLTETPGFEGFVLDIPAIVAMIVYAAAFWILIQLIYTLFQRERTRRITTYEED